MPGFLKRLLNSRKHGFNPTIWKVAQGDATRARIMQQGLDAHAKGHVANPYDAHLPAHYASAQYWEIGYDMGKTGYASQKAPLPTRHSPRVKRARPKLVSI